MTWVCIHGAAGPHLEVSHITPDRIRGTVWISWCVFAVCAGGGGGGGSAGGAEVLGPKQQTNNPRTHRKHKKASTAKKPKHQPPHQQQTQKHTHTQRHLPTGPTAKKTHTPPHKQQRTTLPSAPTEKTNNTLPYEGVCCLGLNWPFTELLVCRGFSCRAQQQTKTTPFRLVCADRVTCRSPKPMLTARACVW